MEVYIFTNSENKRKANRKFFNILIAMYFTYVFFMLIISQSFSIKSRIKLVVNQSEIDMISKIINPPKNSSRRFLNNSKTYLYGKNHAQNNSKIMKKKSENDEALSDQETLVVSQNFTKLTFDEMVTIYHDIWNTMLIGKGRVKKKVIFIT